MGLRIALRDLEVRGVIHVLNDLYIVSICEENGRFIVVWWIIEG